MTAYQKRKQERDEAKAEVYRLRRLIHGVLNGTTRHKEVLMISLEVQIEDEIETLAWSGDTTKANYDGILPKLQP